MKLKLLALFFLIIACGLAGLYYLVNEDIMDNYSFRRVMVANTNNPQMKIEYIYVEPTLGRPWPALIYVHGYQAEGRRIGARIFYDAKILQKTAERGVLAVAVSLPGYGRSDGEPDFAGPFSQGAIKSVINNLRERDDIRANKIALLGFSRGAIAVANVAADDNRLAGAVLLSPVYDLVQMMPKWEARGEPWSNWLVKDFQKEAGMSPSALSERSVSRKIKQFRVPLLAIHGAADVETDPAEGQKLVYQLRLKKLDAEMILYPGQSHAISDSIIGDDVANFLDRVLH